MGKRSTRTATNKTTTTTTTTTTDEGEWSPASRAALPLILVRGFGGLDVADEQKIAYQGFNDGTVYPRKRGENYIYEGLVLRFMKSDWSYHDATNVVAYYGNAIEVQPPLPQRLIDFGFTPEQFFGHKVVIDPAMALSLIDSPHDPCRSMWVFRYYDLNDRNFIVYAEALVRLIAFIRQIANCSPHSSCHDPKVNIIAHSMGGLIVRAAVQGPYVTTKGGKPVSTAHRFINKIVTLGTPHQGISFQFLKRWIGVAAGEELEGFNPDRQADEKNSLGFKHFWKAFPLERLLTVVGTNYRTYSVGIASGLNRWFSVEEEFGPNYNRSDGLVKQAYAQIPGAPRTFVHKCHGGFDSLVTSRESFEIATRFFFGNVRARLRLVRALVKRGQDRFGKSEYYFGASVKPRFVDFELFHQSAEAENCYGPFGTKDLTDANPAFGWAGDDRLIWEGFLDVRKIAQRPDDPNRERDMVWRVDLYVGERDLFGVGFSDNVILRQQLYVRATLPPNLEMFRHLNEEFMAEDFTPDPNDRMRKVNGGWEFDISSDGFDGTFRVELDFIPADKPPVPIATVKTVEAMK